MLQILVTQQLINLFNKLSVIFAISFVQLRNCESIPNMITLSWKYLKVTYHNSIEYLSVRVVYCWFNISLTFAPQLYQSLLDLTESLLWCMT